MNRKHPLNAVKLALLLTLPIGISTIVGIAASMLAHGPNALPSTTFYLKNPWPGILPAAIVEAALAALIYKSFSGQVFPAPEAHSKDRSHAPGELVLGIAIGGGAISLAAIVMAIMGIYRPVGFGSAKGILVGFACGLGAGVAEELLFRAVILRIFYELWGAPKAVVFSSLAFAAAHFGNDLSVAEVVGVLVSAGLLLNGVWLLKKRIWICVGTHFAWNFFLGGIFGMSVSGIPIEGGGLVRCIMAGSEQMTGGASGPEASIPFVVSVAAVGVVVMLAASRSKGEK